MIASEQRIEGCAANNSRAAQVCVAQDCQHHPYVCADSRCPCQVPHIYHAKINYEPFQEMIRQSPVLTPDLQRAE